MTTELTTDERAELEALRRRVAELERERAEEIGRAAAAVADAQAKVYWLDRSSVVSSVVTGSRPPSAPRG